MAEQHPKRCERGYYHFSAEGHMRLRRRSQSSIGFGVALLAVALTRFPEGRALAQPGPPQAPTNQCTLRGTNVFAGVAPIVNEQGEPLARFSGAPTPLIATDFPGDALGKVRVETGSSAGSFRIRGFMPAAQLPLFTVANASVVAGHVWIAAGRAVTLVGAAAGRLRIEKKLATPIAQTFSASVACNNLSLEPPSVNGYAAPNGARGYELKRETLDLFAAPGADTPVSTIHRATYAEGVLFFGNEQRSGFVHLEYHGEVVLDGWAKLSAVTQLPLGEIVDQAAPAVAAPSAPHLLLPGQPRLVRPTKEIPIRRTAKETEPTIGVIEPGAETYVLDQVAGWASVVPKTMNVLPVDGAQFWVKSADLGLSR